MKVFIYIIAILFLFSCDRAKITSFKYPGHELDRSEDAVYPLFNFVLYNLSENKQFTTDSISFWGERELNQVEKNKSQTRKKEVIEVYRRKNEHLGEYYTVQLHNKYDRYYIHIDGKEYDINFKLSGKFYTECCGLRRHIKKAYFDEILLNKRDRYTFEIDMILDETENVEIGEDDLIIAE